MSCSLLSWRRNSHKTLFSFHCEAPNLRMEPVTALGVLSLVLNIMCAALNLIRGVHLAEHSLQVTPLQVLLCVCVCGLGD